MAQYKQLLIKLSQVTVLLKYMDCMVISWEAVFLDFKMVRNFMWMTDYSNNKFITKIERDCSQGTCATEPFRY